MSSRLRVLVTVWACMAALLLAGCSGGQGTPRATLESLQSAVSTKNATRLYELHDADARGFFRDFVRRWRASLDAGREPTEPHGPIPMSRDELTAGEEADAAALLAQRTSPVAKWGEWFVLAKVIAEEYPTDHAAVLTLRGTDGEERDIRFTLEDGRWSFHFKGTRW